MKWWQLLRFIIALVYFAIAVIVTVAVGRINFWTYIFVALGIIMVVATFWRLRLGK